MVTPAQVEIHQQGSQKLVPAVLDKSGALISGLVVTYTFVSSDTDFVKVSPAGVVTSVGRAGTGTVTVKSGSLSTAVPVTVEQVAERLVVEPSTVVVEQESTAQITARVLDLAGAEVSGRTFTFTSANTGIVTVSPEGLVTPAGPAGVTTILVASDTFTTVIDVAVTQKAKRLEVVPNPIRVARGRSQSLVARVFDAVGVEMPGLPLSFESSDPTLVKVTAQGVVSSLGPLGAAEVTVRSGALQVVVPVSVVEVGHPNGAVDQTTPLPGQPWGVAVSSQGTVYVTRIGGDLARADLPGYSFTTYPVDSPYGSSSVAFNPSGTVAYLAGQDGYVRFIDVATNTVIGTTQAIEGTPHAVTVVADGGTVYVGSGYGLLVAIDAKTRAVQATLNVGGSINWLTLSPTQPFLYASLFGSQQVVEIDTRTHAMVRSFSINGLAQGTAVSPDGTELYVANESGFLEIWNLTTGERSASIPLSGAVEAPTPGGFGLALSPDAEQIYVAAGYNGLVVVDRQTRAVVNRIRTDGDPRRVAFTTAVSPAVVTNSGGWVDFIR